MRIQFMRLAIREAERGIKAGDGGPFGAVIVRRGSVLSRAHNEVLGTADPTAHAEVLAIRRAAARLGIHDLSDCTLYTTCEPCPMCYGAIAWARISHIIYGCTAEDAARLGFADCEIHSMLRGRHKAGRARRELQRRKHAMAFQAEMAPIERYEPKLENLGRRECQLLFSHWRQLPGRRLY
jgi:guanine deaminase